MGRLNGHLAIVAVGKLRTSHWQAAQQDYQQRLRRYTQMQLLEDKDQSGGRMSAAVILAREGEALLQAAAPFKQQILLTPEGQLMDSPQLARFLQKKVEVFGRIAFLIGGPLGVAPAVRAQCQATLSLSPLTLPHELARVLLWEQLYRAATILNHEQYHK